MAGRRQGKGDGRGAGTKRRSRSLVARMLYWCFTVAVWGGIALAALVVYHATKLPPIDQLSVPKRPPNIAVLAADGSLIANRGETGGGAITIGEVPPHLPNAFIAIEDRRFRSHFGLDPIGIARALMRNIAGGRLSEGGSTITQQLAKNLFLTQERTASRKIQEAILALWLERRYTKDEILELYMNRVYFGAGAYGVEAAAQRYFGKSARAVTVAEAAVLAGLVQAPSRLAPNRNPEGAAERASQVLAAMAREGFIGERAATAAIAAPARARRQTGSGAAQYAADFVVDILDDFVGTIEEDVIVTTTLQPALQRAAEEALGAALERHGARSRVDQGAVVALSPDGAIRAMVGGRNYAESQFNRAVVARRQPGSAFKPFVVLAALENGRSPDSVVRDGPIDVRGWRPENFSRSYHGDVTLTDALAHSLNTPMVRLIQEVTPRRVVRTAQRLGVVSSLQPVPALALGSSEVTPLELTAAYAAFANGGSTVVPYVITEVRTVSGKRLYRRQAPPAAASTDPSIIAALNGMLRETLLTGTARKAEIPGWPAAGKTGTTQEHRDAWFVGYTGHLVATVWFGNDDGEPMRRVTGGGLPAETWRDFMMAAHRGVPVVTLPGLGLRRGPANPATTATAAPVRGLAPPPSGEQDNSAIRFIEQNSRSGPSEGERNLLQRLLGG